MISLRKRSHRQSSYKPLLTTARTTISKQTSDNYEVQDMDIESADTVLADKDMRYIASTSSQIKLQQRIDEPKTISFMEMMIDYDLKTYSPVASKIQSPPNQPQGVYYTNDVYPKKYFEYQTIAQPQQVANKRYKRQKQHNVIVIDSNEQENDDDINVLRDNLLNELSQKRAQKERKVEEVAQKKDFDFSHYETTIQLARKQIEEASVLASSIQQQQQQRQNNNNNRINPVIIKIGQNETSSDDEDGEIQQEAALQSNISLFLNAAKEQAKLEIQKQHVGDSTVTSTIEKTLSSQFNSPSKLSATIKRLKETSKKDEIRIIRDKINVKRLVDVVVVTMKLFEFKFF